MNDARYSYNPIGDKIMCGELCRKQQNNLGYVMVDDKNPIPYGAYIAWPGLGEAELPTTDMTSKQLIQAVYQKNPPLVLLSTIAIGLLSIKGLASILS